MQSVSDFLGNHLLARFLLPGSSLSESIQPSPCLTVSDHRGTRKTTLLFLSMLFRLKHEGSSAFKKCESLLRLFYEDILGPTHDPLLSTGILEDDSGGCL